MNSLSIHIKFLLTCLLLTSTITYSKLKIEITDGVQEPLKIAIVPFSQERHASPHNKLHKIIASDLESFGEFKVIQPQEMLSFPTNEEEVFYRDWKLLGVKYLLFGSFEESDENERLTVSYYLFDISRGKRLYIGLINSPVKSLRKLAHKISDKVYQKINGIPGIFSTKLVYVAKPKIMEDIYHLRISDIDGWNDVSIFSSSQPLLSPDWSPMGDKIAYVSFEKGYSQIFIQELSSGRRKALELQQGINSAPSWSPDGQYIAAVLSKSGNPDIFIYDLKRDYWNQLTFHYGIDTEPTWSRNGKHILFTSNRSGSPQIYEMNVSSGRIKRKTFEGSYNARGRYLSDGRNIALIHRREDLFHVAIQNLRNGKLTILTDTSLDESPTISPNGNVIIYATKKNDKGILSGITIDAKTKFILPSMIGEVREPAWSPLLK